MILDVIVEDKKKRLLEHKQKVSEEQQKQLAFASTRSSISFYQALKKPGLSIIGEFKQASPSMGVIENPIDLADRIEQYNASVDAISCLTEEDHFHGSVEYFKQIRAISPLPMIRKDFIIEEYQIYEAKVIGADCILLIVAILTDEQLRNFYELAQALAMDVLVEVHDEGEMERALLLSPKIIGVNNRNLKDFTITLEQTKRLQPMVPEGTVFVSESGIMEMKDIEYLAGVGVHAVLVGGALMLSQYPKMLAKEWKNSYEECRNKD